MSNVAHSSSTTPKRHPAVTSAASIATTAAPIVTTVASVTRQLPVAAYVMIAAAEAETGGDTAAVYRTLSSTPMRFHTSHA